MLKYATPDATDLARRLAGVLGTTSPVHQFTDRGLDHGAFIPLMAMYPAADVPVVQVFMPSLEPHALLTLGTRLRTLREEGILVVGSGFMTHSFAVMRKPDLVAQNQGFETWAADALSHGDVDALTDYRAKALDAKVAHPTADHYVPLLLTLGAADDPRTASTTINRLRLGNSTRSIQVS